MVNNVISWSEVQQKAKKNEKDDERAELVKYLEELKEMVDTNRTFTEEEAKTIIEFSDGIATFVKCRVLLNTEQKAVEA